MSNNFAEYYKLKKEKGLRGLGFVSNLPNQNSVKPDFVSLLKTIVGNNVATITEQDIDGYVKSDECTLEFLNSNHERTENDEIKYIRFILPEKYLDKKYGGRIYGEFELKDANFMGVFWRQTSISSLLKFGRIDDKDSSIDRLKKISGNDEITSANIFEYIVGRGEYLNGAGYPQSEDGEEVSLEYAKFKRLKTSLKKNGKPIFIWFSKDSVVSKRIGKPCFMGFDCGDAADFEKAKLDKRKFTKGHLLFESAEKYNEFLKELSQKTMPEPWHFKNKNGGKYDTDFPILASYIEQELNRLFDENKIIYNEDKTKALFNTNLLDKFAHDLCITGQVTIIMNVIYLENLRINVSTRDLMKEGFKKIEPLAPQFFNDINEIVFHSNWLIDKDMDKYDHIINENRGRFPEEYQKKEVSTISQSLDHAIQSAQKIAQRNYKFIVPMYYPGKKRIQLLMPIYLDGFFNRQPDLALVLTPDDRNHIYIPETILELNEVYQDARLIAKPDEAWLNPSLIE